MLPPSRPDDDKTCCGEPSRLAHDERVDGRALRTQSHAYADLPRSLADRVGDDTIEADDAWDQGRCGESAYQPGGASVQPRCLCGCDTCGHGLLIEHAEIGVDLVDGLDERGQQCGLVARRADYEGEIRVL